MKKVITNLFFVICVLHFTQIALADDSFQDDPFSGYNLSEVAKKMLTHIFSKSDLSDESKKALIQVMEANSVLSFDKEKETVAAKKYRVSLTTSMSDKQSETASISGMQTSMMVSHKFSDKETIFGSFFIADSNMDTSGNNFNSDGFGLGGGYSTLLDGGWNVNGSLMVSQSSTSGHVFTTSRDINAKRSQSLSTSVGLSRTYTVGDQTYVVGSLSVSHGMGINRKPSLIASPRVSVSRSLTPDLTGQVFLGTSLSRRSISISGKKRVYQGGFGMDYRHLDLFSLGGRYTMEDSSGQKNSDTLSLTISAPF